MEQDYDDYASQVDLYLLGDHGKEHYRLLAWFAQHLHHCSILDIGTHTGLSAYALAYNPENRVYTFDITQSVTHPTIKNRFNIEFHINDLFDPSQREEWKGLLLKSPLIFLDVDPHNGSMEYSFYQILKEIGYRGLLLCDDIWYFKGMRDIFWSRIPAKEKYDLTQLGHWSGTGLISFGAPTLIPEINHVGYGTDEWTLVTAYFDLTKAVDHHPSVRPKSFYLERAQGVMSCPYNLVVYCDAESVEQLRLLRPSSLMDRTRFIVMDFDQLTVSGRSFSMCRQQILNNRKTRPSTDPRNTATYYLFCLSRFLLLEQTINDDPFASSYFAWINIHMEEMGFKNLQHLDEALAVRRNRFSTCYIDYIPPSLVDNLPEYFKFGRCSMCSGFFTGHQNIMTKVCQAIKQQFVEYLDQGYGHADEQLFSPVFFKHPEWFEHYYGEYQQMITNYVWIHENGGKILDHFINNSYQQGNYAECYKACQKLWESFYHKKIMLSYEQITHVSEIKKNCKLFLSESSRSALIQTPLLLNRQLSMNPSESTIITLLYDVGNPARAEPLLERVDQWRQLTYPIIIWTDQTYYARLKTLFQESRRVQINQVPLDQLGSEQYRQRLSQLYPIYNVSNRNLVKDTELYHLLMWLRPEMWKRSVESNPFNTQTFICLDFGLSQPKQVEQWIVPDQIRMMMIKPYLQSDPEPFEYFHQTHHNIAGGVITGAKSSLLEIISLFQQELRLMLEQGWCQLDEAIMASVVRKHPNLVNFYYGDYCGILSNYMVIRDMSNISPLLQTFLNKRLYLDAQRILNQIDYWSSPLALDIYVIYSILTNYYVFNGQLHPTLMRLKEDPRSHQRVTAIMTQQQQNLRFYSIGGV